VVWYHCVLLETELEQRQVLFKKISQGQIGATFVSGSSTHSLFQNDNRTRIRLIEQSILFHSNAAVSEFSNYPDAVNFVKSHPNEFALFGDRLRLQYAMPEGCELILDRDSVIAIGAYTLPISLYVQSQPLISSINTHLLNMRQDGTIERFKSKWWKRSSETDARCGSHRELANDIFDILKLF
jgi:hypothetical protein